MNWRADLARGEAALAQGTSEQDQAGSAEVWNSSAVHVCTLSRFQQSSHSPSGAARHEKEQANLRKALHSSGLEAARDRGGDTRGDQARNRKRAKEPRAALREEEQPTKRRTKARKALPSDADEHSDEVRLRHITTAKGVRAIKSIATGTLARPVLRQEAFRGAPWRSIFISFRAKLHRACTNAQQSCRDLRTMRRSRRSWRLRTPCTMTSTHLLARRQRSRPARRRALPFPSRSSRAAKCLWCAASLLVASRCFHDAEEVHA